MDSITQSQMKKACMFPENRGRGLMQLEKVYTIEIIELVEYVDRKVEPLTQTVRMHQQNINSAVLQTARHLKTEVQRGTRQQSTENKRKMAREAGVWTIAM